MIVVDASLALKWVLDEPHTQEAIDRRREWESAGEVLRSPALFLYEVTSALNKRVFRGQLTLAEAQLALSTLMSMALGLESDSRDANRALELASDFRSNAAYDFHYVAMAERLACPLWTGDERLFNQTHARFPWVYWIGGI